MQAEVFFGHTTFITILKRIVKETNIHTALYLRAMIVGGEEDCYQL